MRECRHPVWVKVPYGTLLTNGVPFRFCSVCNREEWENGVVRLGSATLVPKGSQEAAPD